MNFVKTNFVSLVVLILVVILFLQRSCEKPTPPQQPTIKRDTMWVVKDSLITSKPRVIKTVEIISNDTIINNYLPDTNYQKLLVQYQDVVKELLAKNIHSDMIRIDTNGYVKVTDTVQKNLITGRATEVKIKYPVITNTITLPYKPVNQVYIGGTIGNNQLSSGLLLKNKKDQIFGASVGINTSGQLQYGVSSFWKLKIK